MSSEETPMRLEEGAGHGAAKAATDDVTGGAGNEQSSRTHASQAREAEQTRQMMAEMLGLERVQCSALQLSSPLTDDGDGDEGNASKVWNKDRHIATVADALAKELTAFREQNGLEGTPEELAHLNQFLAIDYEMLKPHMRRSS